MCGVWWCHHRVLGCWVCVKHAYVFICGTAAVVAIVEVHSVGPALSHVQQFGSISVGGIRRKPLNFLQSHDEYV